MISIIRIKKLSCIFIIIALLFGLTVVASAATKDPIIIGHIHSLSGPMAMYGIGCKVGGEIAIKEINEAGGVLGRPLKQISRDDKLNPAQGLKEAKDLLLNEHADFLTGTISASVSQAISSHCEKEKKIFFVNVSTSRSTTGKLGHRYLFRFASNTTSWFATPTLEGAKQWGAKKIFLINPNYDYGKQCYEVFIDAYKKVVPDCEIVGELWPKLGTTDFGPYVSRIMSSGAEVLLSSLYGGDELNFVKRAVPYGLYDKMHVIEPAAGDTAVWMNVKKGDPAPIGALSCARYPYWAIDDERNKNFVKKYMEIEGKIPGYAAYNQYYIIYALKNAIEAAGSLDTEKIIDALEDSVVDTFLGPVKIRACDHQAMMPMWTGPIGWEENLPFPHVINLKKLGDIESTYRSCEEIEKLRKEFNKQ